MDPRLRVDDEHDAQALKTHADPVTGYGQSLRSTQRGRWLEGFAKNMIRVEFVGANVGLGAADAWIRRAALISRNTGSVIALINSGTSRQQRMRARASTIQLQRTKLRIEREGARRWLDARAVHFDQVVGACCRAATIEVERHVVRNDRAFQYRIDAR